MQLNLVVNQKCRLMCVPIRVRAAVNRKSRPFIADGNEFDICFCECRLIDNNNQQRVNDWIAHVQVKLISSAC